MRCGGAAAALTLRLAPLLLAAGCAATGAADDTPQPEGPNDGWVELFDGRTLEGWTPKIRGYPAGEDPHRTFRVEDAVLRVDYAGYETFDARFGHLFHELELSRYRLLVEYRFVGEQVPGGPGWAWRNSGVMLHGQRPETMGLDQAFPVSLEVQLLGGPPEGERPTANLCTPGTRVVLDGALDERHCVDSASPTFRGDRWVTVEVVVDGGERVEHFVEGELVLSYTAPRLDPSDADAAALLEMRGPRLERGTLSLQSESHPVEFRRVAVRPL